MAAVAVTAVAVVAMAVAVVVALVVAVAAVGAAMAVAAAVAAASGGHGTRHLADTMCMAEGGQVVDHSGANYIKLATTVRAHDGAHIPFRRVVIIPSMH